MKKKSIKFKVLQESGVPGPGVSGNPRLTMLGPEILKSSRPAPANSGRLLFRNGTLGQFGPATVEW